MAVRVEPKLRNGAIIGIRRSPKDSFYAVGCDLFALVAGNFSILSDGVLSSLSRGLRSGPAAVTTRRRLKFSPGIGKRARHYATVVSFHRSGKFLPPSKANDVRKIASTLSRLPRPGKQEGALIDVASDIQPVT